MYGSTLQVGKAPNNSFKKDAQKTRLLNWTLMSALGRKQTLDLIVLERLLSSVSGHMAINIDILLPAQSGS